MTPLRTLLLLPVMMNLHQLVQWEAILATNQTGGPTLTATNIFVPILTITHTGSKVLTLDI